MSACEGIPPLSDCSHAIGLALPRCLLDWGLSPSRGALGRAADAGVS